MDTHRAGDYDIRRLPAFPGETVVQAQEPEVRLPHHEESIVINAPVKAVFEAMTDTERWRDWWPQLQDVRLPDGWTVNGGMSCRVMGMDLDGSVTYYDPDRELGFETRMPAGGRVLQHFKFSEENGGTRLKAEMDASGVAGMMFTRRRLVKEMGRLKANVESSRAG